MASELSLLQNLRAVSRYSISFGILVSAFFMPFGEMPIGWQVVLALIALAVGIPHGAVDHLVTVPKLASLKMALFLTAYLAVVGLAIWGILSANLLGFQLVVLMSAIHFGIGDAAFISEIDKRVSNRPKFLKFAYAFAAGFTPVVIPLVNNQSAEALNAVNPKIVSWAGDLAPAMLTAMVAIALLSIGLMLITRRFAEAVDLVLLLGISLIAPPLVAFAFYFGLWHALRHTGRLTLELQSSKTAHQQGNPKAAFSKAVWAGVPALVLVLLFTFGLGITQGFSLQQELLWYLLVVIWALTVPHMALTARLDARALKN